MQVLAAHVCYAAAACGPSFADALADPAASAPAAAAAAVRLPPPRYCLLGADQQLHPRTFATASIAALQRTEVLEWALRAATGGRAGGGGGGGGGGDAEAGGALLLPLQPYKLLYAHTLAEHGRVPDALLYCQVGGCSTCSAWLGM